jgi:hypothetical protein
MTIDIEGTPELLIPTEGAEAIPEPEEMDANVPEEVVEGDDDDVADVAVPKEKPRVARRIQELTQRNAQQRQQLEAMQAALAQVLAQQQAPRQEAQKEPLPEHFDDPNKYVEAKVTYEVNTRLQDHERRVRAMQDAHVAQQQWAQRLEAARSVYPDFDAVALDSTVPITADMATAISRSELGTEVAYYLGKNRDESARISRLDPISQIRELGRIEMKIDSGARKATATTSTPRPIKPVRGGATATTNIENLGMDAYAAARNEAERASKKRGRSSG